MSMQDPIADLFTRIRNAQAVAKRAVQIPFSKTKLAISELLKDEGYIEDVHAIEQEGKRYITVRLKYYLGKPVIARIDRVSKPSLRVYKGKDDLPSVLNGMGVAIISTSAGILADRVARAKGLGGEVIAYVN